MIDEEFDLVLPSGFVTDRTKLTDFIVDLPHIFQLNTKRKWEMALLQMTLPDRGEKALQDQYWFSVSNEWVVTTNEDGNPTSWGTNSFFYEKVYLDKKIIETRDNIMMYYEFKRLFNDRVLNFYEFGYTLKNMLSVSLIGGKIQFEMEDDLKTLGFAKLDDGKRRKHPSSLLIIFSRPLAHFLGLEDQVTHTLPNGSIIKHLNYKISDSIQSSQIMKQFVYKEKSDCDPLTGRKINSLSRKKDGVHLNAHTSINVECDLLESNYLGGVNKRRVLRKLAFYDTDLDTYVRYYAPKNIIYTPMERLQFQQIPIKLVDDDGNPIKLTALYSAKQYIGETSITVRIRPVI